MLDFIYEWIQNIAFYLILITVLLHMLPDSDYKKYIRFFTGLILILLLITPVLKLLHIDYWITEDAAPWLGEGEEGLSEKEGQSGEEPAEEEKKLIEVEEIQIEK